MSKNIKNRMGMGREIVLSKSGQGWKGLGIEINKLLN